MKSVGSLKGLILLLAGIAAAAGAAQAQVAAPNLDTTAPSTANPAVLMYNKASHVGAGVLTNIKVEFVPAAGDTLEIGTGDGTALTAVLKNDAFGIGVDVLNVQVDADPTLINPPGGQTDQFTDTNVFLAAAVGKAFAVGVGIENSKFETTDNNTGNTQSFEASLPMLGASWAITPTVYLGGIYGSQTVEGSNGVDTAEGDRAVSRVGVGVQWRDKESGFHLEAYREVRELLELRDAMLPAGADLIYAEEGYTNGVTLEVVFSNILVGVGASRISDDTIDRIGPSLYEVSTTKEDDRTLTLGWVPETGLAVTVSAISDEESDSLNPDDKIKTSAMFAGLSVQW
jgi:hypothetical protein